MDYLFFYLIGLLGVGFSARYTWWRKPLKGVPVLMYHHITENIEGIKSSKLMITPAQFAHQLNMLNRMGYKSITLSRAYSSLNTESRFVVLTFDDGYANFYYQAWPLLKEHNMTATVFLVTSSIDNVNFWDHEKGEPNEKIMTKDQIQELNAEGIEFGGHSHTHRNLTKLDNYDLNQEIINCQKVLVELLGHPSRVFSYPYGLVNPTICDIIDKAGFLVSCTTCPGMLDVTTNPMLVPRIIIKKGDNRLDFYLKLIFGRSRL